MKKIYLINTNSIIDHDIESINNKKESYTMQNTRYLFSEILIRDKLAISSANVLVRLLKCK